MGAIPLKERLIFALDVSSGEEAEKFVEKLDGVVEFFKVGVVLFTVTGPDLVRRLLGRGKKVFLDLKFFDVGATVRDAVKNAANLGVHFLTVHGQTRVMESAVEGRGQSGLKVLAVTLLTDLDAGDLEDLGVKGSPEDFVLRRARQAAEIGCDGVIASGREAGLIRDQLGSRLLIVTPGVRPAGTAPAGQKRWVTPAEAISRGADYLVVGKPIRDAEDPRQAAQKILDEMKKAL